VDIAVRDWYAGLEPVNRTRLSLWYVVSYLGLTGLLLWFFPQQTLRLLLSNGDYGTVMPRMVGLFMFCLAIVIAQIIRLRAQPLYATTLGVRVVFLVGFLFLYLKSRDPLFLVILGVVGFGVLLTGFNYLRERRINHPAMTRA